MKISAIIIAKNVEGIIADCIDSVSFCDEVIMVDNNSTDRSVEIARHMGAKVVYYDAQNFAESRNIGLKKAKGDWVLYIDADERISSELRENIKRVIDNKDDEFDAYRFKRKNFYFGNHEWPSIEKLERLFKRTSLTEWYGKLHESARVKGEIGELDGFLLHYTHRDLTSMVEKTLLWSGIEAELRFNTNHPRMSWWRFFRVMVTGFYDSYVRQKGYKAGTAGLVESMFQSFSMFMTYARLWEMQNESQNTNRKSQK